MFQLFLLALAAVAASPKLVAQPQTSSPQQPAPPAPPQKSEPPAADPADVGSPERIVAALYDSISGPAGKKRDWNRLRSLFIDGARLMPTNPRPAPGSPPASPAADADEFATEVLDVESFVERIDTYLEGQGFFEREVARRAEGFGHIMHVFSTYEARHDEGDPEPFARGINSIQLMNDGRRWWVVSIFWESESPRTPIPQEYLPGEPKGARKGADKNADKIADEGADKGAAKGAGKAARKGSRKGAR